MVGEKQRNKYEWMGREVNNINLRKKIIPYIIFFSCKGANIIFELNSLPTGLAKSHSCHLIYLGLHSNQDLCLTKNKKKFIGL